MVSFRYFCGGIFLFCIVCISAEKGCLFFSRNGTVEERIFQLSCTSCPSGHYFNSNLSCSLNITSNNLHLSNCSSEGSCRVNVTEEGDICRCIENYERSCCTSSSFSSCSGNPCRNEGTCIPVNATDYICNCTGGFSGVNCSTRPFNCTAGDICHNNGTCDTGANFSKCICSDGFYGIDCEHSQNSTEFTRGFTSDDMPSPTLPLTSKTVTSVPNTSSTSINSSARPATSANSSSMPSTSSSPTLTASSSTIPLSSSPSTTETSLISTSSPPTTFKSSTSSVVTTDIPLSFTTATPFSNTTDETPQPPLPYNRIGLIVGLTVSIFFLLVIIAVVVCVILRLKKKRATSGNYEPSKEEKEGTRNVLHNFLTLPPEEKLI